MLFDLFVVLILIDLLFVSWLVWGRALSQDAARERDEVFRECSRTIRMLGGRRPSTNDKDERICERLSDRGADDRIKIAND